MSLGYLLGGLANLSFAACVVYWGGIKRRPVLMRQIKWKFGENMSDDTAAKVLMFSPIILVLVGVFLLVWGGIKS